jgi:hypothetical protein
MKLLKLPPQDDPYKARINTLFRAICEDEEYMGFILCMLIAYCKSIPEDEYYALPKLEQKLEEAFYWFKDWRDHELPPEQ